MHLPDHHAVVYTDGSCHTQLLTGAWVAIIFTGGEKYILSAVAKNTTHNRMELTAVIEALTYLESAHKEITVIEIVSDSQYVTGLPGRAGKLLAGNFLTKKGKEIQNADLVKVFLQQVSSLQPVFTKVKAHQKQNGTLNYNIEADKYVRKLLREAVKESQT